MSADIDSVKYGRLRFVSVGGGIRTRGWRHNPSLECLLAGAILFSCGEVIVTGFEQLQIICPNL